MPKQTEAPWLAITRRSAMRLGMLGLAGATSPPALAFGALGFTHAVASGEPGPDRALLWTRFVAPGSETRLVWEVSDSIDFARIAASGETIATPERDYCVKTWAAGLRADSWYFFRFVAPSGEVSPVGRTRTLPQGPTARFRMAVFSCSNLGFGFFNAYAHAAAGNEFDLAVHLGDYFYEYERGEYPTAKEVLPGREAPLSESATLAQYRERLALYRADPDLQRLHQILPMVSVWDDHESANDAWEGGAENHDPAREGDWAARKRASRQAYREWMPVSDDDWARYEIGDLATLLRLETRLTARTEALNLPRLASDATPAQTEAAFAAFRDGAWREPGRELLGAAQQGWVAQTLRDSVRAGKPWQVLAQQVVMGELKLAPKAIETMPAGVSGEYRQLIASLVAAGQVGVPLNMDAWDGYPAARARLLGAALEADANLVVLSGDSHNAWAFDLDHQGTRAGVEMGGHSVTSPGAEANLPWIAPDDLARASVATNPQLKWCDTAQRGYMAVDLTPTAASSEWRFLSTVRHKAATLAGTRRMTVLAGQRRFESG